MDDALAATLLMAIEANRLVVVCGAGLSLAPPSRLPNARQLATECADKYQQITGIALPANLKDNLDQLAKHFKDKNELQATFIGRLVNWEQFDGKTNAGHEAIADFLACKGVSVCVTTNYDLLVESAARTLGERDFRAVVDQNGLNQQSHHGPYLKIHGCASRTREDTVWCVEQLSVPPLQPRIAAFRAWLVGQLQQRDLLLIGFWSDWAYLNAIVAEAVVGTEPRSIIVVDPADAHTLEQKAPDLWRWANSGRSTFLHVQVGGESFLEELRRRFSRQFLNQCINAARPDFQTQFGPADPLLGAIPDILATRDFYHLRRAFCGQMAHEPVRRSQPQVDQAMVAIVHLLLFKQGAVLEGAFYRLNGDLIRLIWTPGKFLSAAKKHLGNEPPIFAGLNRTVCVGATDDGGVPPSIVRPGVTGHIIRGGVSGDWITANTLFAEHGANP